MLVGDQAQIEPALAAAGGAVGDRIEHLPLHPASDDGRDARRGPAQKAGQLHQPLLATAGRAQGRRHRQRRQHRRHGRRRPAAATIPQRRPPARHRRHHADAQGPVRPHRRRRQRQSRSRSTCTSTASWEHLRPAHPAARAADDRPDERRLRGSQGQRPGQGHARPLQRAARSAISSSATSKAATSTAAPAT